MQPAGSELIHDIDYDRNRIRMYPFKDTPNPGEALTLTPTLAQVRSSLAPCVCARLASTGGEEG